MPVKERIYKRMNEIPEIDTQIFEKFVYSNLDRPNINTIDLQELLNTRNSHKIVESLSSMGLLESFRSFMYQELKKKQDSELQNSALSDQINSIQKELDEITENIASLRDKHKDLEDTYQTDLDFYQEFPDNPNRKKRLELSETKWLPIYEEILKMEAEIKEKEMILLHWRNVESLTSNWS